MQGTRKATYLQSCNPNSCGENVSASRTTVSPSSVIIGVLLVALLASGVLWGVCSGSAQKCNQRVEEARSRLSLFKQVKAILDEKTQKAKNYLEEMDYWIRISELVRDVPDLTGVVSNIINDLRNLHEWNIRIVKNQTLLYDPEFLRQGLKLLSSLHEDTTAFYDTMQTLIEVAVRTVDP